MRGLWSGRASTSSTRGVVGLLALTLLTTVVLCTAFTLAVPVRAEASGAADAFRFWGYYQWTGDDWTMAQKGAAQITPKDGSVDGWRYAIGGEQPRPPRAAGNFERICGSTPAQDGKKRVAVVIDYGLAEEAPDGETAPKPRGACALVEPEASSAQVLAAAAPVRDQKGMVCAIDKFPSRGCGDPVANPPKVKLPEEPVELALPAGTPSGGGLPIWGVAVAAIAVIVILGGLLTRRGRPTNPARPDDTRPTAEPGESGSGDDPGTSRE